MTDFQYQNKETKEILTSAEYKKRKVDEATILWDLMSTAESDKWESFDDYLFSLFDDDQHYQIIDK